MQVDQHNQPVVLHGRFICMCTLDPTVQSGFNLAEASLVSLDRWYGLKKNTHINATDITDLHFTYSLDFLLLVCFAQSPNCLGQQTGTVVIYTSCVQVSSGYILSVP